MKDLTFVFTLLVCAVPATAQNLVPNGGFEEYTECPDNLNQVARATGWYSLHPTVDFFHTCAGNGLISGVPNNGVGYQQPFEGLAYSGLITYFAPLSVPEPDDSKEVLGAELLEPLQQGVMTHVSFRVSPALGGPQAMKWSVDGVGLRFSTTQSFDPHAPHPNGAVAYLHTAPTDTATWILVSGEFVADSSYSYVRLGNFFTDSLLHPVLLDPDGDYDYAYVYIDDVCVSQLPGVCATLNGIAEDAGSILRTYPNPASGRFVIHSEIQGLMEVELLDLSGRVCAQWRINSRGEPVVLDVSDQPTGSYRLKVLGTNRLWILPLLLVTP